MTCRMNGVCPGNTGALGRGARPALQEPPEQGGDVAAAEVQGGLGRGTSAETACPQNSLPGGSLSFHHPQLISRLTGAEAANGAQYHFPAQLGVLGSHLSTPLTHEGPGKVLSHAMGRH